MLSRRTRRRQNPQVGFVTGTPPAGLTAALDAGDSLYVLRVTATDPSTASSTVNVLVRVDDVNEAPDFEANAPTSLTVVENGTALFADATGTAALPATAYVVTDADVFDVAGTETRDDAAVEYEVRGADAEYFTISDAGVLTFAEDDAGTANVDESHTPDYELKSSYSINIVASSGANERKLSSSLAVTVKVLNGEDPGSVELSQREPQVGRTVIATLIDPDGGVTIRRWRWYRGGTPPGAPATIDVGDASPCAADTAATIVCVIANARSSAYIPSKDDIGRHLTAVATYTDDVDSDAASVQMHTEAVVQDNSPANAAPEFPDQDPYTAGDQSDETSRSVAETPRRTRA